jgi:hypothetical protein
MASSLLDFDPAGDGQPNFVTNLLDLEPTRFAGLRADTFTKYCGDVMWSMTRF